MFQIFLVRDPVWEDVMDVIIKHSWSMQMSVSAHRKCSHARTYISIVSQAPGLTTHQPSWQSTIKILSVSTPLISFIHSALFWSFIYWSIRVKWNACGETNLVLLIQHLYDLASGHSHSGQVYKHWPGESPCIQREGIWPEQNDLQQRCYWASLNY